jgi:hypothetical protein
MGRTLPAATLTIALLATAASIPATARQPVSSCELLELARGIFIAINVEIPGAVYVTLVAFNQHRDIVGWYSDATGVRCEAFCCATAKSRSSTCRKLRALGSWNTG